MGDGVGRLGFGLAGAAVGSFFGVPGLGFVAGSAIGGLIFPPDPTQISGPRLQDLKIMNAKLGNPIPWIYGTVETGGTLVWGLDIQEHVHKQTETEGKGGASTVTRTYYYSQSFAVIFTRGPIGAFIKLFGDGKVMADFSASTGPVISHKFIGDQDSPYNEGILRFYLGTATQEPDPLIEENEGVGNTPAYRLRSMVVCEDLPLGDWGNRTPQLTAQLAGNKADLFPSDAFDFDDGTSFRNVNWFPDNVHFLLGNRTYNAVANTILLDSPYPRGGSQGDASTSVRAVGREGFVYHFEREFIGGTVYKHDPYTHGLIARTNRDELPGTILSAQIIEYGPDFLNRRICVIDRTINDVYVLNAVDFLPPDVGTQGFPRLDLLRSYDIDRQISGGDFASFSVRTLGVDSKGRCYILANSGVDGKLCRLSLNGDVEKVFTIPGLIGSAMVYCQQTNSFIVMAGSTIFRWSLDSESIEATMDSSGFNFSDSNGCYAAPLVDGKFWTQTSTASNSYKRVVTDDLTVDYALTPSDTSPGFGIDSSNRRPFFDIGNNALWVQGRFDATLWWKLYLDRVEGGVAVDKDVIEDIAGELGYDLPNEIDASAAIDTSKGFIIGGTTQGRQPIEQLMNVHSLDMSHLDGKLTWGKRGTAPVLHIPASEIAAQEEGVTSDKVVDFRRHQKELPRELWLHYMDPDADYEENSQPAERSLEAVRTRRRVKQTFSGALDNDDARGRVGVMLNREWAERYRYEFFLTRRHLRLRPGITATWEGWDGQIHLGILSRVEYGVNWMIRVEAFGFPIPTLSEAGAILSEIYTPGPLTGAAQDGFIPQSVAVPNPTILHNLDIPVLRPVDDGEVWYQAANGAAPSLSWGGAHEERGTNNSSFDEFTFYPPSQAGEFGVSQSILGDHERWTVWDDTNTLSVSFDPSFTYASISDLGVFNEGNALLVGSEITLAGNVVDNGNGQFDFSHLLRGRKGTEWSIPLHTPNELVVVLDAQKLLKISTSLDDLNELYYYRAFTAQGLQSVASGKAFTWTGVSLKPRAPANPKGSKSGDNWTLSATERSRTDGGLHSGRTVRSSEAVQDYKLEILSEDGLSVIRTESLSSLSYTYTKANMESDFASGPPSPYPRYRITTRWTQINVDGIEGYPRTKTHDDFPTPTPDTDYSSIVLMNNGNMTLDGTLPQDLGPTKKTYTPGSSAPLIVTNPRQYGPFGYDLRNSQNSKWEVADHADLSFVGGDFGMEIWTQRRALGTRDSQLMTKWTPTGDQREYAWSWEDDGNIVLIISTDGTSGGEVTFSTGAAAAIPLVGVTQHAAIGRSGSTLYAHIDGVEKLNTAMTETIFSGTSAFTIGPRVDSPPASGALDGYILGWRVYKGFAPYTTGFTPPTLRFSPY